VTWGEAIAPISFLPAILANLIAIKSFVKGSSFNKISKIFLASFPKIYFVAL